MNRQQRSAAEHGEIDPAGGADGDVAAAYAEVVGAMRAGRLLEAQLHCSRALEGSPQHPGLLHLMARVSFNAGQFDHAVEWAWRAVATRPTPDYLTTLGSALLRLGRSGEAIKAFDKAVGLKPDEVGLWWQLGEALIEAARADEALLCFEHIVKLDPHHGGALFKAGYLFERASRYEEALTRLDRSVELRPDHAQTLHARALALSKLGRIEEALADNMRAIALDPNNFAICCNIGNALRALGRQDSALAWYDRALSLSPNVTSATNKALSLAELGRFDEAMAAYRHALGIDPDQAETIWNFALLQLLTGDFEAGWRGREARWRIPGLGVGYPRLSTPMWLGEEPVAGKTVVVCQDEGLGDAIQFARYIPLLAAQGARVILLVAEPLCPLLARLNGVSQCLAVRSEMALPPFDLHVAIDSLPLAFGTRLHSIPAGTSYLPDPEADRLQAWEDRLGPRERLRVGLVWSGNPNFRNDRNRSVPLAVLSPILDVDATFVSLQKDPRPQDIDVLSGRGDIVDCAALLTDFAETAALVASLDLVITVDTSVAHLAAAMGRPTWILLPHVADWRWLLDRDDSPWYPTVRLFRQTASRDYASVVERVRAELSALVARNSAAV